MGTETTEDTRPAAATTRGSSPVMPKISAPPAFVGKEPEVLASPAATELPQHPAIPHLASAWGRENGTAASAARAKGLPSVFPLLGWAAFSVAVIAFALLMLRFGWQDDEAVEKQAPELSFEPSVFIPALVEEPDAPRDPQSYSIAPDVKSLPRRRVIFITEEDRARLLEQLRSASDADTSSPNPAKSGNGEYETYIQQPTTDTTDNAVPASP